MPSPLYQQFQPQPQNDIFSMAMQFKQNPLGMLSQRFNIPQNITSPNDILQYLLNTRQVTQQQVNTAMQMSNNPMFKNLF
ncbi:MAG: hypothetical protein IKF29_00595 [Oceanobacillus sp.]|nr:hypothetical protein [Oceanobacillus sp.]